MYYLLNKNVPGQILASKYVYKELLDYAQLHMRKDVPWYIINQDDEIIFENEPTKEDLPKELEPLFGRTVTPSGDCLKRPTSAQDEAPAPTLATDLLERARGHMQARAATYDRAEGERSMAKTVALYNLIADKNPKYGMTESEGWLFMALLKMVRSKSKLEPHQDSIEDLIAYAALYGEARMNGK